MNVRRLADGSTLYADGQGLMQSYPGGNGVVHHVRRGIIGVKFASHVIADCEQALRTSGRCILMVDGYETKMHTTEFRDVLTKWFREHETATVNMLAKSRMLEMALNVANLVLGSTRARIYYSIPDWEVVGREALPSFKRRAITLPSEP